MVLEELNYLYYTRELLMRCKLDSILHPEFSKWGEKEEEWLSDVIDRINKSQKLFNDIFVHNINAENECTGNKENNE